jgi:hypothetical protein
MEGPGQYPGPVVIIGCNDMKISRGSVCWPDSAAWKAAIQGYHADCSRNLNAMSFF